LLPFEFLLPLYLDSRVAADIWYVSNSGVDAPQCGRIGARPCKTIRYTIANLNNSQAATVYIDSSNGVYRNESSTEYLDIRQTIILKTNGSQRAVIKCSQGQSKLYRVVGQPNAGRNMKIERHEQPHFKKNIYNENQDKVENDLDKFGENDFMASLRLDGIEIHNCVSGGDSAAAAITAVNATIRFFNSLFENNSILLHNPDISSLSETCSLVHLIVENSSFTGNGISDPFMPGIILSRCANLTVDVHRVLFRTTPILMRAADSTKISFTEVSFDNLQVAGSAVTITLSPKENSISFSNCNVTNHASSHLSAISIRVEEVPKNRTSVMFSNVNFTRNQRIKNSGATLSVISRFSREPATIHLTLNDCWFVNNSAADTGGAVYISKIDVVTFNRCHFAGNSGTNGGAVYLNLATNVTISKCEFYKNSAVRQGVGFISTGGAVHAFKSSFVVDTCNFTANYASFSGSAVHVSDSPNMSIRDTYMEEDLVDDFTVSPYNSLLFVMSVPATTQDPTIRLLRNQFVSKTRNSTDHGIVMLNGQIANNNATVVCPAGRILRNSVRPASDTTYPYAYEEQSIWCQACPQNTYLSARTKKKGEKLDEIRKFQPKCSKCPEFSTCSYGILVPYENYWASVVSDGGFEMTLCPHAYCFRNVADCESCDQCCTKGRRGAMCTECSDGHAHSVRFSYSLCMLTDECWAFGSNAMYIVCFSVAFFLLLMFLYKILTGIARNLSCKEQLKRIRNDRLSEHVRESNHDTNTSRDPGANDDDTLLHVEPSHDDDTPDDTDLLIPTRDQSSDTLLIREVRNSTSSTSQPVQSSTIPNAETQPFQSSSATGLVPMPQSLTGFVMSVVFFYQLLPVVYPRISASVIPFDQIINTLVELFLFSPPLSATGICSLETTPLSVGRYFTVVSFYWIQLAFIVVLFLLMFLLFSCTRSSRADPFREQNIKMFGTHFFSAFLFLQLFWFIPLLRISLSSIHCIEFEGNMTVYDDVSTVCHRDWQIFTIVYLVCCVVPLCITLDVGAQCVVNGDMSIKCYAFLCIFPIFTILWIPLRHCCLRPSQPPNEHVGEISMTTVDNEQIPPGLRSIPQQLTVVVQSVLVRPFRSYYHSSLVDVSYLTVILLRNFLIVTTATLLAERPIWGSLVVSVVCVFFTYDHVAIQPFANKSANRLESVCLLVLSMFSLMNLFAAAIRAFSPTQSESASIPLTVFDFLYRIVVMTVYASAIVLLVIRLLRIVCCRCKKA